MLTERSHRIGDLTLEYVEAGNGDPLVLLHGFSGNWRSWSQEIGLLSHRWRVIAPSSRGQGGSSSAPDGQYGYDVRVADAASFISDVAGGPVVLGGHSMGGATAMGVAGLHPGLVRAVVLEDPHVSVGYVEKVDELRRRRDLLRCGPTFAKLVRAIQADSPETSATAARLSAAKQIAMDPEAYTAFIEESMFDGFDPDNVLSDFRCPVLLMQADFSLGGVVNDDAATRLTDQIPDCSHVKFPGIGHNIHEDAPIEFRRTLFDFLDTIQAVKTSHD